MGCEHGGKGPGKILAQSNRASNIWAGNGGDIKAEGYIYFTVELADEREIENAYLAGQQQGLPVVYGEWAHEGGYHYYPAIDQVKKWLQEAQLILDEEGKGDSYYHLVVHKEP